MAVHCPLTALLCLTTALLTTRAETPMKNADGCPEDWTLFGTRCFKFFDSKATWTVAETTCQYHGANLASIHSAEEHAFIKDLIKEATGEQRRTWIGGLDAAKEGLWLWSDGSVWDYSNWHAMIGEPNNQNGNEHFAEINWNGAYWNDLAESLSLDSICAQDAPPRVVLTVGGLTYKSTPNLS